MVTSILSFAGCNDLKLNSTWPDREITVDGTGVDWQNAMVYVEKANVAVGLFNDEEYIYVCLTPVDRRMAFQMVRLGCTVWFDPEGGKNKTFGIRFPLGMLEGGNARMFKEAMRDPTKYQSLLKKVGDELEILGPGKGQRVRMSVSSTPGIEIKLGHSEGRAVYELKVPLARSAEHPYAIGTDMSKTIGIGFETPKWDREEMQQSRGGRGRVGRGGGRMGGMDGKNGGRGRSAGMQQPSGMPEPLELWAKVTLASENPSAQH